MESKLFNFFNVSIVGLQLFHCTRKVQTLNAVINSNQHIASSPLCSLLPPSITGEQIGFEALEPAEAVNSESGSGMHWPH